MKTINSLTGKPFSWGDIFAGFAIGLLIGYGIGFIAMITIMH